VPRRPRWYDPVPEATAVVSCGGEAHRVTWRRGKLVLEAHDLTAERTMLVFGGELCECMKVLEMWAEQFRIPPDLFVQLRSWLGPNAHLAPLEFELPRRLGVIVSWERAWRAMVHLPIKQARMLDDELKARALAPLRLHLAAWKARTGARVVAGCAVALLPANEPPTVEGTTDGVAMRAVGRLHARWVIDVWPKGIATVDDAFVLDVLDAVTDDDLRVLATRWEPTAGVEWAAVDRPARLRRPPGAGGTWKLTWEDA
jgi:hypothetical protein